MTDFLNALVILANFILVPGLAYGSQLALGALGVTLVYGVLRFSNFAHGETMAFGTMLVIIWCKRALSRLPECPIINVFCDFWVTYRHIIYFLKYVLMVRYTKTHASVAVVLLHEV